MRPDPLSGSAPVPAQHEERASSAPRADRRAPASGGVRSMRLRIDLGYDGTDFHGFASQKEPGLRTVQGELERALSLILRQEIRLTVAGRTDAGVHAVGQVAHADIDPRGLSQRSIGGDPSRLVRRLGRMLDDDLRVERVSVAPPGFDARFSALRRHYRYRVSTHPGGAPPLRARDTAAWPRELNLDLMNAAAAQLIGLHDFAAFCRAREGATTVRDLQSFSWRRAEPELYLAEVTADAFCWSMVRSLVGACLVVGQGRLDVAEIAGLLALGKRSSRIPVAPARGLSLMGVDYPPDDQLARRAEMTRARREPGTLTLFRR